MASFRLITITIVLFFLLIPRTSHSSRSRIVTKMIHYNSIDLPYFDTNAAEHRDLHISLSRLRYLKVTMQEYLKLTVQYDSDDSNDDSDNDTDFETGNFVNTSIPVFLVGFIFGSLEAAQLVALDTGSNLLWVQCKLDIGGNRTFYRNYWPAESSTYSVNVRCEDFYSSTPLTCIPTPTLCWYVLKYLGEVIVRGNPAFERFIYGSSFDNQPAHELNPLFGCTRKNS